MWGQAAMLHRWIVYLFRYLFRVSIECKHCIGKPPRPQLSVPGVFCVPAVRIITVCRAAPHATRHTADILIPTAPTFAHFPCFPKLRLDCCINRINNLLVQVLPHCQGCRGGGRGRGRGAGAVQPGEGPRGEAQPRHQEVGDRHQAQEHRPQLLQVGATQIRHVNEPSRSFTVPEEGP